MADYGYLVNRMRELAGGELPLEQAVRGGAALLNMMAPDTMSLLRGDPAPPIANLPSTPGKVPSTDDPRVAGSMFEIGTTLFPTPTGATAPLILKAMAAGVPGITRKLAPSMLRQLTGKDAAKDFHAAIEAAKKAHPQGAAVELKSVKDYAAEGVKLFTTPDNTTGFAIMPDGDVVSVFKHPSSPFTGAGTVLAQRAKQEGGKKLDAFDTVLPSFYEGAGFKKVARLPFDPQFKPEGWTYKDFRDFKGKTPRFVEKAEDVKIGGRGQPDIVGMVADPPGPVKGLPTPSFDYMQQLQDLAMAGRHPVRFIPEAKRAMIPGIYERPDVLAREAAQRIPKEDPALHRLFGVHRDDLYAMAREREAGGLGDLPPPAGLPANPRGSAAASAIMTPENRQRLVDVLAEGAKYPEIMHGMYPWYIQDPVFQQMVRQIGFEQALKEFPRLQNFHGLASIRSQVLPEIERGTAAYVLDRQNRFPAFAQQRRTELDVPGHYAHAAQVAAMENFRRTGELSQEAVKTPAYIMSAGVPETGYNWNFPTGDLHFVGGIGLPDVRGARVTPGMYQNISASELAAIAPWWRSIAADVGMTPSPAQSMTWGLFAGPTGVKTDIGVPKLELQARRIMQRAHDTGKKPEQVRDELYRGLERWGIVMAPGALVLPEFRQDRNGASDDRERRGSDD